MERSNRLMALCNKFMIRRTSTVLKKLLPNKVEQVGVTVRPATRCLVLMMSGGNGDETPCLDKYIPTPTTARTHSKLIAAAMHAHCVCRWSFAS